MGAGGIQQLPVHSAQFYSKSKTDQKKKKSVKNKIKLKGYLSNYVFKDVVIPLWCPPQAIDPLHLSAFADEASAPLLCEGKPSSP